MCGVIARRSSEVEEEIFCARIVPSCPARRRASPGVCADKCTPMVARCPESGNGCRRALGAAERCRKSHPQPVTGPCSVSSMWVGVRSMCSARLPGRVFAPGHRRTGRTAPRQRFPSSPEFRCRIRVFLHAIPGRWRPVVLAGIAPGGGRWGAMAGWLHGARAALASMVSGRRTGFGTTRGSSTSPRRLTAAAGSSDSSGIIAGRRSPVA